MFVCLFFCLEEEAILQSNMFWNVCFLNVLPNYPKPKVVNNGVVLLTTSYDIYRNDQTLEFCLHYWRVQLVLYQWNKAL